MEDIVRDFTLIDQNGSRWTLSDQQADRAIVLVFYRGDW